MNNTPIRRPLSVLVILSLLLIPFLLPGCGGNGTAPASGEGATRPSGNVTVFAAASLTDVFKAAGEAYRKKEPDVSFQFNFASSSVLATQIEQGARTDVFASADTVQMQRLADKSLTEGQPSVFARNLPVIVVPAANRARVASPRDLGKSGLKLVLAAPDVPIGNYSRQVIDHLAADSSYGPAFKDAVARNIVSNESNVRAVLTKVELDEADAGIVYKTDAIAAGGKVQTVAIPESANVIAEYPVALLKEANNVRAARDFIAFLRGDEGRRLMADFGFDPVP